MPTDPKQWTPSEDDFDRGDFEADDESLDQPFEEELSGEEALYEAPEPSVDDEEAAAGGGAPEGRRRSNLIRLIVAALVIILLVAIAVSALRGGGAKTNPTPTVAALVSPELQATFTPTSALEGGGASPIPTPELTPTVQPPTEVPPTQAPPTAAPKPSRIAVGARVKVANTDGEGMRLRAGAGTKYATYIILKEGKLLTITKGPVKADGMTWWHVESDDGMSGWAAQRFLKLVAQ